MYCTGIKVKAKGSTFSGSIASQICSKMRLTRLLKFETADFVITVLYKKCNCRFASFSLSKKLKLDDLLFFTLPPVHDVDFIHVRTYMYYRIPSLHTYEGLFGWGTRTKTKTHHSIEVLHHAPIQQIIDNEKKNNNLYHICRTEFCQRFLKYRKNQLITIDTTFTIAQV